MGIAKAIRVLEEAKTLDDLQEVKKRIDEAIAIIREAHLGKRYLNTDVVRDIPFGKMMDVINAIKRGGKKPPQRVAILSIILVKNGGEAKATELGDATGTYASVIRDIVKRASHVFEYDRETDTIRIRPEAEEKIKKILEG